MEAFVRYDFNAQHIPFYDCGVVSRSIDHWYAEGKSDPYLGVIFLMYGTTVELIYGLVMGVLWGLRRGNACYSIMFLLGVFDMMAVCVNSITSGVLWVLGASFCVAPNVIYIAGCLGLGLWCGACLICLILVLNRLCDLGSKDLVYKVFGKRRIFIWLLIPPIYAAYFAIFTPPILFNSSAGAWFFSPMILNTPEETKMFYNIPHTINNFFVVFATCLFYILLCITVNYKYGFRGVGTMNNLRKSIAFQAVIICLPNVIASLVYALMQFVPLPSWVVLAGHIGWQAGHGVPAIVYLTMNRRIRRGVAKRLGVKLSVKIHYINPRTTSTPTIIHATSAPTIING